MKAVQRFLMRFLKALFRERAGNDMPSPIVLDSARLILTELQREQDALLEAGDKLDDKTVNLLGWAALTLTLVSSLSLKDLAQSSHVVPFIALGLSVALFLSIIVLGVSALFPKGHLHPIRTDWDEMCDFYLMQNEQNAVEQLLSQYRMVIDKNVQLVRRKANGLQAALVVFAVLVIALILTATHPLWQAGLP